MDLIELPVAVIAPAADGQADPLREILEQLDAGDIAASGNECIRSFLEDRYRWAIDIADSLQAYLCARGLDLLQPGFADTALATFPALLARDMQATMTLAGGKRAVQIAGL